MTQAMMLLTVTTLQTAGVASTAVGLGDLSQVPALHATRYYGDLS